MAELNKTRQDNHKAAVEVKGKTPSVTLNQLCKLVLNGFAEQREFNKIIVNRLDKLEQYVLDQFKKHGW